MGVRVFYSGYTAVLFLGLVLFLPSCSTGSVRAESAEPVKKIEPAVKSHDTVKEDENLKNDGKAEFSEYLVNEKYYSTNGGYYQRKYKKDILAFTGTVIKDLDLDISKGTVGFYFDKKSNHRERLFLGLDVHVVKDNNLDYGRFSVGLIKEEVMSLIDEIYKYGHIMREREIVGVVVGFKWKEGNESKQVNIWVKKENINLVYKGKLTVNEMYQRSTITNTSGKIILLPI